MINIEDHNSLVEYLIDQNHISPAQKIASRVLHGGVSNRTVWVDRPGEESRGGESWVLKQALHKLRVEADWFSDPSRVHREAAGIRWLSRCLPQGSIPTLVFEDHNEHIIAMTAVPQPHENWKELLLGGDLRVEHVRQFGEMLVQLHRSGFAEREAAAAAFADDSFFESLRLEPYYVYTASQVPAAADFLFSVIGETRQQRISLVHGDYSPKNILVYKDRSVNPDADNSSVSHHTGDRSSSNKPSRYLRADRLVLLDHEVIHFGDPAFDLGFSLTHFLSKAHHLPQQRNDFGEAATIYWQTYLQGLGDVPWREQLEARAVRNALACLLARVAGRSPFEYLNSAEKARQQTAVVAMMKRPPATIATLVSQFIQFMEESK